MLVTPAPGYYIYSSLFGVALRVEMKLSRSIQLTLLIILSAVFCGSASAQLIQKPEQPNKNQKQTLIAPSLEDQSVKPALVIDFNAELNKPTAPDKKVEEIDSVVGGFDKTSVTMCTTGDLAIDSIIRSEAREHNVDLCLIMLVMGAESTYKRNAISPKGAMGLMQLIPETAARFGVKDVFNPKENIHGGTAYLRWLLDYFHNDVQLALAGYNAGEGAVVKYKNTIPPYDETQRYVRVIYGQYVKVFTSRAANHDKTPVIVAQAAPSYKIMIDFNALQEGHPTNTSSSNPTPK